MPCSKKTHIKKRILLVDDDPTIRSLLRTPLHDAGYDVVEMDNGMKASFWAVRNEADLLVLDVAMPEMDGIELASEMKHRRPNMPILAISAGENVMSKELCLRFMKSLGAVETLPKPFDLNDFMSKVKKLLSTPLSATN